MMTHNTQPIALTVGEPSGIGPDITLQLLQNNPQIPLIIYADPDCLIQRARHLGLPENLLNRNSHIQIETVKFPAPISLGQPNVRNAPSVVHAIHLATQACLDKRCRALLTGPVHKGIINQAGIKFSGHTEFLTTHTHADKAVMMLATPTLKIALATTHLPLSKVPQTITESLLTHCITTLEQALRQHFHLPAPKILVCGLNPHAGEDGYLGNEEIHIIAPTVDKLRKQQHIQLIGPVAADTAFIPQTLQGVDAVLAMYHDQGLPVLKALGFDHAVNITLGLPIIRTSVDHGVALSLAGTGKASHNSLKHALQQADYLSRTRMHPE